MVTRDRWKNAQEYEAQFWDSAAEEIETGEISELSWYGWRAEQLETRLRELGFQGLVAGKSVVLEVGSGPVGVVSFFPAAVRFAIDPLQTFYNSQQPLTTSRSEDVTYIEGIGESLSVSDRSCDLVIIENCIDHVQSPQKVMLEIARVLRSGGILHLTVNCRTSVGYYVHRALSTLQLDPGHPHTFTPGRIRDLVEKFDFEIVWFDAESYLSSTLLDLRTAGLRGRAKALLGISEFTAGLIARRQ